MQKNNLIQPMDCADIPFNEIVNYPIEIEDQDEDALIASFGKERRRILVQKCFESTNSRTTVTIDRRIPAEHRGCILAHEIRELRDVRKSEKVQRRSHQAALNAEAKYAVKHHRDPASFFKWSEKYREQELGNIRSWEEASSCEHKGSIVYKNKLWSELDEARSSYVLEQFDEKMFRITHRFTESKSVEFLGIKLRHFVATTPKDRDRNNLRSVNIFTVSENTWKSTRTVLGSLLLREYAQPLAVQWIEYGIRGVIGVVKTSEEPLDLVEQIRERLTKVVTFE